MTILTSICRVKSDFIDVDDFSSYLCLLLYIAVNIVMHNYNCVYTNINACNFVN